MADVPQVPVFHHLQGSDASPQCITAGCVASYRVEPRLSVDSSCRDDLAKMPCGKPISAAFLTSLLGGTTGAAGAASTVTSFRVDPPSVIEGRHSTTFRLLLNPPSYARCSEPGSTADGVDGDDVGCGVECAAIHSSTEKSSTGGAGGAGGAAAAAIPSSVFVKRIVCKELPARSLSKWR